MKKLLRDVLAGVVGLALYIGGGLLITGFILMSLAVASNFSAWTLLISVPIILFLVSLFFVVALRLAVNWNSFLDKLDKLLRIE